jgi:hypothetical protein
MSADESTYRARDRRRGHIHAEREKKNAKAES